jgi:hypothetical protein
MGCVMIYRRQLGSDQWHWDARCSRWPGQHFEERATAPLEKDAFCLECLALTENDREIGRALLAPAD